MAFSYMHNTHSFYAPVFRTSRYPYGALRIFAPPPINPSSARHRPTWQVHPTGNHISHRQVRQEIDAWPLNL